MKKVAGTLRLDLANFREMAAFAQFGSDLDAATQKLLARGERMVELLKQPQYSPLTVEKQVLILFAGTQGFVDELPTDSLGRYETELYAYAESNPLGQKVLADIKNVGKLTDELRSDVAQLLNDFHQAFQA